MILQNAHDLAPPLATARQYSLLLALALAACDAGPLDDEGAANKSSAYALAAEDTLALTPAAVSLEPGQKQRFLVRTPSGSKVPTTSIEWTVTGGTMLPKDSNLVYWAGSNPGSYEIGASIQGRKLTANVTIGETPERGGGSGVKGVPPSGSSCLDQSGPILTLTGAQREFDNRTSAHSSMKIDARLATWIGRGSFPVKVGNGKSSGICFSGGKVQGTLRDGTSWKTYHSSAGLFMGGPNSIWEDWTVINYGDAIRVEDSTDTWTIRRAHVVDAHDDCVENDRIYGGLIDDSFFEGCYVWLSERPGSGVNIPVDGSNKTVTIQNSLVWHKPMPTVYRGPAPGTGPLWKWSSNTTAIVLTNTVFRVDQAPSHGDLNFPPRLTCSNVTMVWLGSGSYPGSLPSCVTLTQDKAVWDRAVADWHARHPGR